MSPANSRRSSWVAVVRWVARTLAALVVAMILSFLFGEGVDVPRLTPIEWLGLAAFAALCTGLLLGWKREVAGGVLSLGALAVFYAIELAVNGRLPHGWVWRLLAVPGVLYLISAGGGNARRRGAAA
jgi:hypothetical protein